jgi:hypothetical protein
MAALRAAKGLPELTADNLQHAADLVWVIVRALADGDALGLEAAHGAVLKLGGEVGLRQAYLVDLIDRGLRITGSDRPALARFLAETLPQLDPTWSSVSLKSIAATIEAADGQARGAALAVGLLALNERGANKLNNPTRAKLTNAATRFRGRLNPS